MNVHSKLCVYFYDSQSYRYTLSYKSHVLTEDPRSSRHRISARWGSENPSSQWHQLVIYRLSSTSPFKLYGWICLNIGIKVQTSRCPFVMRSWCFLRLFGTGWFLYLRSILCRVDLFLGYVFSDFILSRSWTYMYWWLTRWQKVSSVPCEVPRRTGSL